jgi:hypothetical protein
MSDVQKMVRALKNRLASMRARALGDYRYSLHQELQEVEAYVDLIEHHCKCSDADDPVLKPESGSD